MTGVVSERDHALRGPRLSSARRGARRDAASVTLLLAVAIFVGSTGFRHLDHALLGYLFATILSVALIAYRTSLFWRRPPSAHYGRALWAAAKNPAEWPVLARAVWVDMLAQSFIRRRDETAWRGHLLLASGTAVGFAVTLPLVFGWLRFEAVGPRSFRALVFSLPTFVFSVDGALAWGVFHALILAAFAVVIGVAILARRRIASDSTGAMAPFHVIPLALLLLVAVTGLTLPVAGAVAPPSWFRGFARAHELSVVALLLALPFSKLFHLFLRPLHLGVALERARQEPAKCGRCGAEMTATPGQLRSVDSCLSMNGIALGDRIAVCPGCRRRELAMVHDRTLRGALC